MLEQIFGSRTRTKLLKIFFLNPDKPFFIRELTRRIDTQINSVRRELQNLVECGIISETLQGADKKGESYDSSKARDAQHKKGSTHDSSAQLKKYFIVNQNFILYEQLKEVFVKSPLLVQDVFLREAKTMGTIEYAIMTGYFLQVENTPVDLFLVGDIQKGKLLKFIQSIEKEFEREVKYTTMTHDEFEYRKSLGDRFLFTILEGKKIVLIDSLDVK